MAVPCRWPTIARTFRSLHGAARTSLFEDRNVNSRIIIQNLKRTLPWNRMGIIPSASITLKICGKNDRVDKRENGSIGAPGATSTNANMVDYRSLWPIIRTIAIFPGRTSAFGSCQVDGCIVGPFCAHRARRFAVRNLNDAVKSVRSAKKLHHQICIPETTSNARLAIDRNPLPCIW